MRSLLPAIPLACVLVVAANGLAFADVTGSDFDGMAPGPYPFGVSPRFISGADPTKVAIAPAGALGGGAPPPPAAAGNVLCIDNIQPAIAVPTIIEFDFACEIDPAGVCQLKYDFSGAAWLDGGGFEVFVDAGGEYINTDDEWTPPVVIPPSTTFGSNTEGTGVCDGSGHTVTFLVKPGTVMYIDNLRTLCSIGTVKTESSTWGAIKALYRE